MVKVLIGAAEYDSLATLAFADVYLGGDVMRATTWALRNDDAKGRGLVSATRAMLQLPWVGGPPPFEDPPEVVSQVTAMLAADMLAKPRLFADASGSSNVKTAKAGSAQVEFFQPVSGGAPIPMALWTMLLNAGLVVSAAGGREGENEGAEVAGISGGCRPLGGRMIWDYPIAAEDTD